MEQYAIYFALVCAVAAVAYGLVTAKLDSCPAPGQ